MKPFLMQLPEKYREAIEAKDLKGTPQKDFAEELGIGHSTIKLRVHAVGQCLAIFFVNAALISWMPEAIS